MDERSSLGAASKRGCFFRNARARNTRVEATLPFPGDNHAWNTSTSGVVGYLAPRLRGERGETRVKFSRDISQFLRGSAALDESAKPPPQRPPVRYGDSLWLVTCPPVPKPNLQPDFNVSVFECFDTSSSTGLRELDESVRSVPKSAESTSI